MNTENQKLYDINAAVNEYTSSMFDISEFDEMCFSKYSPAFVISNEPLRFETSLTPNAKNVLTVAASGDQALFYKVSGAKHIDTFDISFCARIIQEIKVAAISELPRTEYQTLLQELFRCTDAINVKLMAPILPKISRPCTEFMQYMNHYHLFNYGGSPFFSRSNILTRREYDFIRSYTKEPFNFIWTDIINLHTKLNKKYDVINLSNVFDYMSTYAIIQTIKNLEPFLALNGCFIICDWEKQIPDMIKNHTDEMFKKFDIKTSHKWHYGTSSLFPVYDTIVKLQKTR